MALEVTLDAASDVERLGEESISIITKGQGRLFSATKLGQLGSCETPSSVIDRPSG
jgi:hypothetical protein